MFSKTFAIDNYFMHLPEYLLDQGRDLISANGLAVKQQDDKGYWIMSWQDINAGETEVVVGRKNVKAYSCECTVFVEKKMCKHVAAALILIYDQIEEKKLQRKEQIKHSRAKIPRIHLKQIVQQLSEKELKKFILEQAGKSALLAGELKAQYAHKVELPNSDDKYYLVIKNYTTALTQGRLNEHKLKKLEDYLTNLIRHGEDLCSSKNYREAGLILTGLFKFLAGYVSRYRDQDWSELSMIAHQFLEKIFRADLAPNFRKYLVSQLRSIYREEPYLILDIKYNLYCQLYRIAISDKVAIYEDLKELVANNLDEEKAVLAGFAMAGWEKDLSQLKTMLDDHSHRLKTLRNFISILQEDQSPLLKEVLVHLIKYNKGTKTKNWAMENWLDQERSRKVKSDMIADFIIHEGRMDWLSKLRDEAEHNWPRYYKRMILGLRQSGKKAQLLSTMVFNEDQANIIELLRNENDLELILQDAGYIYSIDKDFLRDKLEILIKHHLAAHVGFQSADLVLEIFSRLGQLDLHGLVDDLFKMILSQFPERTYLIKYIREVAV